MNEVRKESSVGLATWKLVLVIALAVSITIVVACLMRYDTIPIRGTSLAYKTAVREDADAVIVMDRWTGKSRLVKPDCIERPIVSCDRAYDGPFWYGSVALPGDVEVDLKIKWRCGKLYYIINIEPYTSEVEGARKEGVYCRIDVDDSEGFELLTISEELSDMTHIIGEDGSVHSLQCKNNRELSLADFNAIDSYSVHHIW